MAGDYIQCCPRCGVSFVTSVGHACSQPFVVTTVNITTAQELAALRAKYASAVRTLQILARQEVSTLAEAWMRQVARDTLRKIGEPVEP